MPLEETRVGGTAKEASVVTEMGVCDIEVIKDRP